jgi:hypothetical protein
MGNEQKPDTTWGDGWVRYEWSDEEVAAAVAYLKERFPHEWAELEHLEKTTGDLSNSRASSLEFVTLLKRYEADFDHRDIIELLGRVRAVRRTDLGLE